ncbi:MFS transporter [Pseudomonas sp. H3(2019)]|uniref:MFS transporter n=1 Tax=Pseudomonas sp. H3(2019) TaxID=2598724 RepID=UPI001C4992CC|nr:MFS transporter [Pseudomonas sp. H3(2019)]
MKTKIFPGWYVVFAAHLLLALIFGGAYSFGAFFSHIQSNFDVGRFSVASVFSLTAFIYYAVGVFSGSLADRISTRVVVCVGIILLALGFFLSSLASGSLQLFLVCFCSLIGLGVGLVYVPTVTAVQRWFVKNRSKAFRALRWREPVSGTGQFVDRAYRRRQRSRPVVPGQHR